MQRIAMRDLDPSCGGLLPLIAPLEAAPAIRDDRGNVWLTREEVRVASLRLAETIASEQKQLVFLFCGANSETVIGLLAAAAAGHATALIDPSLTGDRLKGLVEAYQPELILGSRAFGEKLRAVADAAANTRSLTSEAGVIEWIARDAEPPSVPINPALELLLSTSGTTGSQKYVRLSRDAIVANARQIAEALAIDERSVGVAHLPLHYSYGLSIVTSHLAAGGGICLVDDSITSPSFWSKIGKVGGSHFPGVPFHYAALARLGAGIVPEFDQGVHPSRRSARSSHSGEDSRMGDAARRPVFRHVWSDRGLAAHDDLAACRCFSQSRVRRRSSRRRPIVDR